MVVTDAVGDEDAGTRVPNRDGRGSIDEGVVDVRPELICPGGVGRLRSRSPSDLPIDPTVAEL